jgi:MOSC domain-containing protein YiiM
VQSAAALFGRGVPWDLTRRNVTVAGLDAVPTAPGTRLRVGGVLLESRTVRVGDGVERVDLQEVS